MSRAALADTSAPIVAHAAARMCLGADRLRALRSEAEAQMHRLIALLDDIDGDADFEPQEDDEDGGDAEEVCEDEGAQCDDEGDLEADGDPCSEAEPIFPDCRTPIRSTIDPSLLPPEFYMTIDGDCLDPVIRDGDRVLVSRLEPVRPGDFIALHFHRAWVPRGGHQLLIKRLISDERTCDARGGPAGVEVEMLNPPMRLRFPGRAILALHRVVRVDNASPSYRMSEGDLLAAAAQRREAPGRLAREGASP